MDFQLNTGETRVGQKQTKPSQGYNYSLLSKINDRLKDNSLQLVERVNHIIWNLYDIQQSIKYK